MMRDTKRLLADTFLLLAEEKPVQRITVRELINACSLNRNTFYYYFSDVPKLMEWILSVETERVIKNFEETHSAAAGWESLVGWIELHPTAFRHIYGAIGREGIADAILAPWTEKMREYTDLRSDGKIAEEDRLLIASVSCDLYLNAILLWVSSNMRFDLRARLKRIEALYGNGMDAAIRCAIDGTMVDFYKKGDTE